VARRKPGEGGGRGEGALIYFAGAADWFVERVRGSESPQMSSAVHSHLQSQGGAAVLLTNRNPTTITAYSCSHATANATANKGKPRKEPEAKHALFHKFCGNPNAC
jgi:hypothetical protein